MSSEKEARAGANGDRRQPPALTKTLSGIRSRMQILRKRSSASGEVDEEEWNRRMETWEKKRRRLSGSDWDKSYREAVRNRLNGKKPWRTSISANKPLLQKVDQKSEEENHGTSSATESPRSDWGNPTENDNDNDVKQKDAHRRAADQQNEKLNPGVVWLKRETSKMELNVTDVVDKNVSSYCGPKSPPMQSKNFGLESNIMKANEENSGMDEDADDCMLTRTKSMVLTDANNVTRSSTRFLKTVLSPIQSEGECSKLGEAPSSGVESVIEETVGVLKKESSESDSPRPKEVKEEQCAGDKRHPAVELPTFNEVANDGDPKMADLGAHAASLTTSCPQTAGSPSLDSASENKEEREKCSTKQPNTGNVNGKKHGQKKVREKEPKNDNAEHVEISCAAQTEKADGLDALGKQTHQHGDSDDGGNESNRRRKLTNKSTEKVNVDLPKIDSDFVGHDCQVTKLVGSVSPVPLEQRDGVPDAIPLGEELQIQISKSSYPVPTTNNKTGDSTESKEIPLDSRSSTITYPSKERVLHAIYSSPEIDIFGSRKKPPAQPLFIRTVLTEDKGPVHGEIVTAKSEPEESEELLEQLAESRLQSEESFMIPVDSLETLSSDNEAWYREFRHPIMSSEEFMVDRTDCYKEIIIDRRGCRSFYDGCCRTKTSKDFGKSCVRRYEVSHDASKCSLKHLKKLKHVRYADQTSIQEASSAES